MIPLPGIKKVYLYRHPVDMRNSFDGLAALVWREMAIDPLNDGLFVFFNRPRTFVKLLFWDESGYCLIAKRLEKGTFTCPDGESKKPITLSDLYLILEGIEMRDIRRKKRFSLKA